MERRQFGRAIAEFGLIKQKIAGMTCARSSATRCRTARSATSIACSTPATAPTARA
jgi:alkylation response protein AidB-like acyl-CoA dehydrogenase